MRLPLRAKKLVLGFLLVSVLVSGPGLAKPAFCLVYLNYEEWGGTWHDVDKGQSNGNDEYMCWAAASANILYWAGWCTPAYNSTTLIYQNFRAHWNNRGSLARYGWNWWLNADSPPAGGDSRWSEVSVPGGGGYWPQYEFKRYFHKYSRNDDPRLVMSAIDYYLRNGYGVIIGIYEGKTGHTLTVWGYGFDYDNEKNKTYKKLFITDSDDRISKLWDYPVCWDADVNQWEFSGGRYSGWRIECTEALERRPGTLQDKEPVSASIAQSS
ncbi:MAG: hypothetical protein V1736_03890 [Pseudomonadota bacterium]